MTLTPRERHDPEIRRRAMMMLEHANLRLAEAERSQRAAVRFATECTASLEEIATASGLSRKDVKRLRQLRKR